MIPEIITLQENIQKSNQSLLRIKNEINSSAEFSAKKIEAHFNELIQQLTNKKHAMLTNIRGEADKLCLCIDTQCVLISDRIVPLLDMLLTQSNESLANYTTLNNSYSGLLLTLTQLQNTNWGNMFEFIDCNIITTNLSDTIAQQIESTYETAVNTSSNQIEKLEQNELILAAYGGSPESQLELGATLIHSEHAHNITTGINWVGCCH